MPRQPRRHVPGGVYHVILRGNNRQEIFFSDQDRLRWNELLAEGIDRFACRVHAYCWMPNHVHMAVQVFDHPLSALMRWAAAQYSRATNKRQNRTGHLFERRHKAIYIGTDAYLLQVVRYIHLNPVAAGICASPVDYSWSSHGAYVGLTTCTWLSTHLTLSLFAPTLGLARVRFARYIAEGSEVPPPQWLGGCKDSREFSTISTYSDLGERGDAAMPEPLDSLVARVCDQHGVEEAELASASRERRYARIRALIAIEATRDGSATLAEIARRFRRSDSGIARSVRLLRRRQRKQKSSQS